MERRIGVRKFRDELTRHLGLVRRGGRIVITDRGRPVALLLPYLQDSGSRHEERLMKVLSGGHVVPAERPFMKNPPLIRGRGAPISDFILEDRR